MPCLCHSRVEFALLMKMANWRKNPYQFFIIPKSAPVLILQRLLCFLALLRSHKLLALLRTHEPKRGAVVGDWKPQVGLVIRRHRCRWYVSLLIFGILLCFFADLVNIERGRWNLVVSGGWNSVGAASPVLQIVVAPGVRRALFSFLEHVTIFI